MNSWRIEPRNIYCCGGIALNGLSRPPGKGVRSPNSNSAQCLQVQGGSKEFHQSSGMLPQAVLREHVEAQFRLGEMCCCGADVEVPLAPDIEAAASPSVARTITSSGRNASQVPSPNPWLGPALRGG